MFKYLNFVSIHFIVSKVIWLILSKSINKCVILKWSSMTCIYGFYIVTGGFISLNIRINETLEETKQCQVNSHCPLAFSWLGLEYSTLSFIFGPKPLDSISLWLPRCMVSLVFLAAVSEHHSKVKGKSLLSILQYQYSNLI